MSYSNDNTPIRNYLQITNQTIPNLVNDIKLVTTYCR